MIFLWIFNSIKGEEYIIIVKPIKKNQENNKNTMITVDPQSNFDFTLDTILEKEAGIMIQRYGGEGSYSLLRIRGSNANQVNIYLEGIPLNFASYSEVNLSDLQINSIGEIQIQKNGSLPGFTGSSIGGSLNLILETRTPKENQIYIRGGSFGTAGIGLFYHQFYPSEMEIPTIKKTSFGEKSNKKTSKKQKNPEYKGGWSFSLYREVSDQNYSFINHNGTIYLNRKDDFKDKRENAWYKKTSSTISGFWRIPFLRTEFKFLNDNFYRIHGIPGPITRKTRKTKREHWRNTSGVFSDTKGLGWDRMRLKTRFYYTWIRNRFFDPKNELGFRVNHSEAFLHNKGLHILPIFYFSFFNFIHKKIQFLLGYEEELFSEDKFNSFQIRVDQIPLKKRYHQSVHFSDEISFINYGLEFLTDIRYEEYRNNFLIEQERKEILIAENPFQTQKDESSFHFVNGSFLVRWSLKQFSIPELQIWWRYNQEKRIPSFIELFGERGSIIPNLQLVPELSFNYEIGINLISRLILWDIRLYQRKVRNLIQFVPNSQFSLRAENVEQAKFIGAELSIQYKHHDMWKVYIHYHYQEAKRLTPDNLYQKESFLPLLPLHTWTSGLILFPEQTWEYGFEINYYGAYFRTRSNDYFSYQIPRWIYHIYMYYRYYRELLFYCKVRNVQNRYYEDIIGYPLPGRSYDVGLKYFF